MYVILYNIMYIVCSTHIVYTLLGFYSRSRNLQFSERGTNKASVQTTCLPILIISHLEDEWSMNKRHQIN